MALEAALRGTWHAVRDLAPRRVVEAVVDSPVPRATVAGLLTARPARFALYEVSGGQRLRQHRLRNGDEAFSLHHGGADASVVAEVFRAGHYAVPEEMQRRLRELGRPLTVVDLGAHVGLFGLWAARAFPGAHLTSYEPDPFNHRALKRTVEANAVLRPRWRVIPACAAAGDGTRWFIAGASSSSRLADGDGAEVVRVPARDALPDLVAADVLKVDIEGGEWELLADSRFDRMNASLVFLEYHRHLSPAPDPRGAARSRLEALGYAVSEVFATEHGTGLLRGERSPLQTS